MRITADRIATLVRYGLTDYQARAYLALLEYPESSAGELAKASRLPRNTIYEVLNGLQGMGLVEIRLGGTRKYRARPLSSYLDRRVEDLRADIDEMESRKAILDEAFRPPEAGGGELGAGLTRVIVGRRSVAREVLRMLAEARHEVLLVCSAGGLQRMTGYLRQALEGVDRPPSAALPRVDVVVPADSPHAVVLDPVAHLVTGETRRVAAPLRMCGVLADGAEALLIQPIPDDARLNQGDDFALLTSNPAILADYASLLRAGEVRHGNGNGNGR